MHDMTAGNLRSAFSGEAMAHMRYKVWGARAEREGFANVARLFRAVLHAEQVHASNHFAELRNEGGSFAVAAMGGFGMGTTLANLQGAIEGETFEIREMYPVYLESARYQGEKGAERSFHYALSAEKIHAAMYERARQAVEAGKDVELGPVQICNVCGYTAEGGVPDKCPICSATKDKFQTYS